jgi:hypothetical protein
VELFQEKYSFPIYQWQIGNSLQKLLFPELGRTNTVGGFEPYRQIDKTPSMFLWSKPRKSAENLFVPE